MDEMSVLQALGNITPEDMAQANVGAKIVWALLDVAVGCAIYIIVCKTPKISKWIFEYDIHLDKQADKLKNGEITDPIERGMVTEALARVKAKKILGLMLILAASLLE